MSSLLLPSASPPLTPLMDGSRDLRGTSVLPHNFMKTKTLVFASVSKAQRKPTWIIVTSI